jgi:NDP-sugar pyrophosphorylase family protein
MLLVFYFCFCLFCKDVLTLGYPMSDPSVQCRSRGVLQSDPAGVVLRFLEKPPQPPPGSSLASAPLYFLRPRALLEVPRFLEQHREAPVSQFDAPGFLLAHLVEQQELRVRVKEIPSRIDIGSLVRERLLK